MPTSNPQHLSWLCQQILEHRPKSILDIGVGFGSKGMLFREYSDIWDRNLKEWQTRIDGVEIFEEYITDIQRKIYNNIYIGNILNLIDTLPDYDLVFMGDVIEHIEKETAKDLLEKLKKKGKIVIIVTPEDIGNQGTVFGNTNEAHISQWYLDDFKDFDTFKIANMIVAKKCTL
jgi:2-polyprenyl-3-methyl-5-hydroxy-6-metoxy-1,4-benzoquinol methylase